MDPRTPEPVELDAAQVERANAIYRELRFGPSRPGLDRTFGLIEAGEPVALGRLQDHGDGVLELGGFWTREDRRGTGLARRMVLSTLDHAPVGTRIWCLPLAHLVPFYRSCGLTPADTCTAPDAIRAKLHACTKTFGSSFVAEHLMYVIR